MYLNLRIEIMAKDGISENDTADNQLDQQIIINLKNFQGLSSIQKRPDYLRGNYWPWPIVLSQILAGVTKFGRLICLN